jgi:xylulokinase
MCHAVPGKWCVFGCMLSAAGSLQWYADELAIMEQAQAKKSKANVFDLLIEEAKKASDGSDGLFFLPYLTGERCPHPDPRARGAWIGLTRRHGRAEMVRSLLEGVTFGMTDMLNIMAREMNIPVKQIRATGGGAKNPFWRQLQADIYNAPLALTNSQEGGAFGVALLAGVGTGIYKSVPAACREVVKVEGITKPRPKHAARYAKQHAVYEKLYGDLKERFAEIAALGGD